MDQANIIPTTDKAALDCSLIGYTGVCCVVCHDALVADYRKHNGNSRLVIDGLVRDVCCYARDWKVENVTQASVVVPDVVDAMAVVQRMPQGKMET